MGGSGCVAGATGRRGGEGGRRATRARAKAGTQSSNDALALLAPTTTDQSKLINLAELRPALSPQAKRSADFRTSLLIAADC